MLYNNSGTNLMNKIIEDKLTIKEVFNTIIGWSMFILVNSALIFLVPFIMLYSFIFDRNKKVFAYIIKLFFYIFSFLNFVQKLDIDFNNLKAPKKGERRIYVLNHASMFDSITMNLLPGPIKSIMKESYARIPVIGWIATSAGNIVLKDVQTSGDQMDIYMNIIETLEKGSPLVIFPEGTKSKNSKIGNFHHGSFKIALDTKADLVPVVFDTWNVIRPGGLWIRDTRIVIRILDTIKYNNFKDKNYKEISKIVKTKLIKGLLEARDQRRSNSKKYYRHIQKYIDLDNEMRKELKELTKLSN